MGVSGFKIASGFHLPIAAGLLLAVAACGDDSADAPVPSDIEESSIRRGGVISKGAIRHDGGYGYWTPLTAPTPGDTMEAPSQSKLRLYEDGVALGPGHALHVDIRAAGKGRFSHWRAGLYFSTSDNSDPRSNGRTYSYRVASDDGTVATTPTPTTSVPKPSPTPAPTPTPSPDPSAIGPQPVLSTALSAGTLFVASNGSGTACTAAVPCSLRTATGRAIAGDVVFLRGGTYVVTQNVYFATSGRSGNPITFESYPGETAVLDGSALASGLDIQPRLTGDWNVIRRIEFRGMPQAGIAIRGNHNVLDGVIASKNRITGIMVHDGSYSLPYGSQASYNVIRNSVATDNSDVGLSGGNYNNGNNADGIGISSGDGNVVINCFSARNSDDGIDAWRSTNTRIAYSISTDNGRGDGNGNGIKGGGLPPSNGTVVEHVLAYKNRAVGFDSNTPTGTVTFRHVTAWSNGRSGIYLYPKTTVDRSIAAQNAGGPAAGDGLLLDNAWQRAGTVSFMSTDPASPDFLRPTAGGGFEDVGAVQ